MNNIDINHIADSYQKQQAEACRIVEAADGQAQFSEDRWQKEIGHGITRVMQGGAHIAKAAINFSQVEGPYSDRMAQAAGGTQATRFAATGVSSIMHPVNPYMPIVHMNVRYFELDTGERWFGGGIDLTPHYIDEGEAAYFHAQLKAVCDTYHPTFYPKYKAWADDYFYLPHRNETRGVGGIFFDRLKPGDELNDRELLRFTENLLELYPKLYAHIINHKKDKSYGQRQLQWQALRRGRYVEFNLVLDRGTKFGLESGGNTESILVSMPPQAAWDYQTEPEPNSPEAQTISMLKKGVSWI